MAKKTSTLRWGVEGFLHPIIIVGLALQEMVADEGGLLMEHPVEDPVGDEGRGEEFLLPMEAITLYLLARQGQGGLKLSEQTVDGVDGNLPDTEETEHVVDTVGVEEVAMLWKRRTHHWHPSRSISSQL